MYSNGSIKISLGCSTLDSTGKTLHHLPSIGTGDVQTHDTVLKE
jgi:hypothetical protein